VICEKRIFTILGAKPMKQNVAAAEDARPVDQSQEAEVLTYTVPEAGAKAGLKHSSSYEAARRGEMPTIRFGKLLRVPKVKWDATRMSGGKSRNSEK
jgi:hypothetical protein